MEYSISKQELQKISLQFRTLSSRLLRTDSLSAIDNLKRLINYIDTVPLINKFIKDNHVCDFDIPKVLHDKQSTYGNRFEIPIEKSKEISFTYQLLSYAANNHANYFALSWGYADRSFNNNADRFNEIVVNPFINHIISYFEEIMIDSGMHENSNKVFHFHGPNNGQMNFSYDSSNMNAAMTVNSAAEDISKLVNNILEAIKTEKIPLEEKEELTESIEAINEEISSVKPKKKLLGTIIKGLTRALTAISLNPELRERIGSFITMAQQAIQDKIS